MLLILLLNIVYAHSPKLDRNPDRETIPNAYWVLESIHQGGTQLPKDEVKKLNQVLVLNNDSFFLSRDGLPDYFGNIDYKGFKDEKSQGDLVNFKCVNPNGGGVTLQLARFRMEWEKINGKPANVVRLVLVINRKKDNSERPAANEIKEGTVVETYLLR